MNKGMKKLKGIKIWHLDIYKKYGQMVHVYLSVGRKFFFKYSGKIICDKL